MALSQQDIQKLKSLASPDTQNSQVMNDEQFSAWSKPSISIPQQSNGSSVGGVIKSIVSAPATIIARPFQAGAELLGAPSEKVDAVTKKITGGLVAPVPQNIADVKKDAGRALETVALGAGPVSGGAMFGAGNSLEQGNNLFSGQTLFQTVLGAGAGKVLELIGKPILDVTGKVVGKVTPEYLSKIASQGAKAVEDFASSHNILPEKISGAINNGAKSLENSLNKPFNAVGKMGDSTTFSNPKDIFETNLKNAEQSIYPKLTPTEKANVKLRDTGGLLNKSVPDLINSPQTKPIIEAVANLPEELQIKPSDSVTVKESKLNQGVSRLHQDTSNYLYEQTKTNAAKFSDRLYQDYMKNKVLGPVIKEFGADSLEVKAMIDNIEAGKNLIENNDAYSVYKARQEFQGVMKRDFPNAFKKSPNSLGAMLDPRVNARLEMARTYRSSLNDFISDELLTSNDPYRARLAEESNLIKATEEMRKRNASDLGKNPFTRYLNRNPVVKTGVNFVKGALKVGSGVDIINHL